MGIGASHALGIYRHHRFPEYRIPTSTKKRRAEIAKQSGIRGAGAPALFFLENVVPTLVDLLDWGDSKA